MAKLTPQLEFRLLTEFRLVFDGRRYLHRASTQGDAVAMQLYEDLATTNRSSKLLDAVVRRDRVLNVQNRRRGVKARRGDGAFGQIIPTVTAIVDPGLSLTAIG